MIAISLDDAREIVAAIDVLETLARPKGSSLSHTVHGIRSQLASLSTDAGPDAHVRTSGPNDLAALTARHDEFIPTDQAAELLGCTAANVRYLARAGRIGAIRNGGRWFVSSSDAHELLDARRCAG
ncbi:helix-turn-helix domain-containing protein [Rhodococcus sp. T2V]|uniref:helix-turn-helix domain-containing protein n=1 Tax=Rhodococcus sp. T2V TaxID=3034164 RepID=UPI0023E14109|nr:helix-turn-helix domain-containing protein [Rhodococcus sp. T2V]